MLVFCTMSHFSEMWNRFLCTQNALSSKYLPTLFMYFSYCSGLTVLEDAPIATLTSTSRKLITAPLWLTAFSGRRKRYCGWVKCLGIGSGTIQIINIFPFNDQLSFSSWTRDGLGARTSYPFQLFFLQHHICVFWWWNPESGTPLHHWEGLGVYIQTC